MRFRIGKAKSESLRRNPKRGVGFEEAQEVFTRPYYQDRRSDDPEQYRAIGWVREDTLAEYCHMVTLWRSTREERESYEANS